MRSERGTSSSAPDAPIDWSRVRRLLLIRLRSIGDTILMTPCLAALKTWRPDVEITVVSEKLAAPLLDDHPFVDKLIVAERSAASRVSLIAGLRRQRFDIAFNMHGGPTGAILTGLSGAKRSIGYRGLPMSLLATDRAPSPDIILGRSRIHSVEQQLALVSWTGMPWPASRPLSILPVSPDARASVRSRLETIAGQDAGDTRGYACIVPGAAFESKRWTAEGFASVADHLRERWRIASIVVAGPGQEGLAREVAAAANVPVAVIAGLSLKELVALLETACVFVGNDGGPMHIASALERPVVAVWGSSDPTVWHPWTQGPYRIVQHESMASARPAAAKPEQNAASIKLIAAGDVISAVDEVLELALEADHKDGVVNRVQRTG